jgi:putative ABC transport system permease protein
MEVVVGATVARERGLRVGDTVVGSHGLGEGGEAHDEHPYRVAGVLAPTGGVVDRLLLTSLESVWAVHAPPGEPVASGSAVPADGKPGHGHAHDHAHDRKGGAGVGAAGPRAAAAGPAAPPATAAPPREVTALLIRYASPIAAAQLPRQVNARSAMQAASPAVESARLVRLLGVGMDALRVFAWVLIGTAGVALFISLFVAISERRRDLALLRSLGLSQPRLFALVLLEGLMLCAAGGVLGLAAGHLAAELVGRHVRAAADWALTGAAWAPGEGLLLLAALAIGLVAALLPAALAYRMDVARELARG